MNLKVLVLVGLEVVGAELERATVLAAVSEPTALRGGLEVVGGLFSVATSALGGEDILVPSGEGHPDLLGLGRDYDEFFFTASSGFFDTIDPLISIRLLGERVIELQVEVELHAA